MNEVTRPPDVQRPDESRPTRPTLRPIPRWVVAIGIPVMVLIAVAAVWLLLGFGLDRDRLDAVRTGGTLGVGLGGVVVLWLAVRRQRATELDLLQKYEAHQLAERIAQTNEAHQRQVAKEVREDAIERRITELYTKAVEQLGSEKAPVRLGGLYALERLAQNNKDQRQTIVNVLCAYLRMPYTLPLEQLPDDASTETRAVHEQRVQERQVRLTAQRILATHLRLGSDPNHVRETFWSKIDLDLTGAILFDFSLYSCRAYNAVFSGAHFIGHAGFEQAQFAGRAVFEGAQFASHAGFTSTKFDGDAWFIDAHFAGHVGFKGAQFARHVGFLSTKFAGNANFDGAQFAGPVGFMGAQFAERAKFMGAQFAGNAKFIGVKFAGNARFSGTRFTGETWFDDAHFAGGTQFENVQFADEISFKNATFNADIPLEVAHLMNSKTRP